MRLEFTVITLATACLLLGVGVAPSSAGGSLCERGVCRPAPAAAMPAPVPVPEAVPVPPPIYVYDYPVVPRWTSNGWSYRPVYLGPGLPPPGPILYAPPPAYGPAPGCGDTFLPWVWVFGCERRLW